VTVTVFAPAELAAVTQVIDVGFTTVTDVQLAPPIDTVAPARKSLPVIVTAVPPLRLPADGEMADTEGAT
jgi:hypothetical protein